MEYNKTELKKYNYLIGQKIKAIRDLKGFKQIMFQKSWEYPVDITATLKMDIRHAHFIS